MDSGVSLDGPIFLLFSSPFGLGLALDLALAAKFLLFSAVFLATDFAAVFALPGALFAACFAAAAVFLVVCEALSSFLAAAATFFATAACSPALTNLAVPAAATLDTVSNFALANFFAVAAPTPGIDVNFDALESFLPEPMVSPVTPDEQ